MGLRLTHGNGLNIYQVGHLLIIVNSSLFPFIKANADQMGVHELSAGRTKNLILAILNERQFSSIENHADIFIVKIELLISTWGLPRHLCVKKIQKKW